MKSQKVLASINLFSVLRCIENLAKIDDTVSKLLENIDMTISFKVPSLAPFYLKFNDGKVRAKKSGKLKSDIVLSFLSPSHFNKMMDGDAMPIPLKGISKINFIKNEFTEITNILESYLIPDEILLKKDEEFRKKSTILTAYVALFAAVELGNTDEYLNALVADMPDGIMKIAVDGSIAVSIQKKGNSMRAKIGRAKSAIAFMDFSSLDVLGGILRGELDSYACIGRGELSVSGKMHMIDNFNKILASVSRYL